MSTTHAASSSAYVLLTQCHQAPEVAAGAGFSPARSAPVNFDVLSSSACKQPEIELPPINLTRACFHDRPCSCSDASSASPCPSKASKVKSCMVSKACAKAAHFGHLLGFQDHCPAKLLGRLRMAGHTLQSEAFPITLENP